jgi:hypothetical protein
MNKEKGDAMKHMFGIILLINTDRSYSGDERFQADGAV